MEKVDAWKTKDGEVFMSETVAAKHERGIRVKEGIKEIVDSFYFSGILQHEMVEELMDRLDELREVLKM
jgi:hypothetical protein